MIRDRLATFDAAADLLAPVARYDTTGGMMTIAEHCKGAAVFVVEQDGEECGAYALRVTEHAAGAVCWLIAGAGRLVGARASRELLKRVEEKAIAGGCGQVAITTIRPGLVRELRRAGYEITGITLRKRINGQ